MIDFTPNPIALAIGPLEIRWYGIGYVAAILAAAWLLIPRSRGSAASGPTSSSTA